MITSEIILMIYILGNELMYLKLHYSSSDSVHLQITYLDQWSNIVCMCYHC